MLEYLFSVYWKNYRVGNVLKEDKIYYYIYDKTGVENAKRHGFDYLTGFPNINEVYTDDKLFPFFQTRISSLTRDKMEGKKQRDPVTKLLETKGKLMTDSYQMIKEKKN